MTAFRPGLGPCYKRKLNQQAYDRPEMEGKIAVVVGERAVPHRGRTDRLLKPFYRSFCLPAVSQTKMAGGGLSIGLLVCCQIRCAIVTDDTLTVITVGGSVYAAPL
jgi:hypothetical protein